MNRFDLVIVGGGLAAAAATENYRKAGGTGSVAIFSQDTALPVHRPPLSKEYLRGDEQREKVFVLPAEFYRDNDIAVHLATRVEALDLERKEIALAGGHRVGFEKLVLAPGARPRRLPVPGADLPGVFYLRSLSSAENLMEAAQSGKRAVIIGAGFIGMEVAATLTQRGIACTVVEMAPRMWGRIVPPQVADFIQSYFEKRDVSFHFGRGVSGLVGDGRVEAVILDDGTRLPADLVVAGVGVALNTELAEQAGLPVENGITVDEYLRTAHSDVYAIGDVANFPDPVAGRRHVEHWDNALNQGRTVAKTLAGEPTPFDHVAYFFSDLFDLSLNMMGYPEAWDDVIIRGDPASGAFTTIYLKDGIIHAALMINDDQHFDTWPKLIKARQSGKEIANALADPSVDPGSVLHSQQAVPA